MICFLNSSSSFGAENSGAGRPVAINATCSQSSVLPVPGVGAVIAASGVGLFKIGRTNAVKIIPIMLALLEENTKSALSRCSTGAKTPSAVTS